MKKGQRVRDAVSKKISKLHREGKGVPQAIATSLSMKRKGKLGSCGGYKKGKK
tara:strand:+ start:787 stop:945 length:159 start_codon:yes stop_codon:yes gene_type:complete